MTRYRAFPALSASLFLFIPASGCAPGAADNPHADSSPRASVDPVLSSGSDAYEDLAVGHAPSQSLAEGDVPVLMISDGGLFKVTFIRTDTRAIFYELKLPETVDECKMSNMSCLLTEIHHSVHDGHDYLDMNLGLTYADGKIAGPGGVHRVRLSDPLERVFTLKDFDWSGLSNGQQICDYDPADPCNTGKKTTCKIWFPHDLDILVDEPERQYAEVMITDLASSRIMKVDFDYSDGNTCGKVDWVLDHHTEGYKIINLPNDADLFQTDNAQYLLTSFYSEEPMFGVSVLEMWKRRPTDTSWSKVWRYPDPESSDEPFLNTPHGPSIYRDELGNMLLRYGHSRGDSDMWAVGHLGTLGAALLEDFETPPHYLFDSKIPESEEMSATAFVRDIEPTSDGRLLVTDSGCLSPCGQQGRVYLIEPEPYGDATGQSGAWTEDRSEQTFVYIDPAEVESYACRISTSYESDFLTSGQLGDDLMARWDTYLRDCPAE